MDGGRGAAKWAAVADPSPQAGGDSRPGEERLTASVPEPGHAAATQAVDQGWPAKTTGSAAARLGGGTARGPAGAARATGWADRAAGRGGGAGRLRRCASAAADDPAWSGSGDRAGLRADRRRRGPVPAQQAGGELSRA